VQRRCYHAASKSNHIAVQPAEVEESCLQKILYIRSHWNKKRMSPWNMAQKQNVLAG